MDYKEFTEKIHKNEEGKTILNDDCVEQIIRNFFSGKDGLECAQYFMLEGFCGKDVSEFDMSGLSNEYFKMITFDGETKFSPEQIDKFHPNEIIEQGKNFSNIKDKDSLHDSKINGEGTTIALLDASFNSSIEEYGDRVIQHLVFEKVNGEVILREYNKEDGNGYHGETTASLAAGKECGVAPKANLRLFGINMKSWHEGPEQGKQAWKESKAALFKYLQKENIVPDIISISADSETLPEAREALNWLNDNNCFVLDSNEFWKYFSLGRTNEEGKIGLDEFVKIIYGDDFQYDEKSPMGKKIKDTREKGKNATVMPFAGRTSMHTGKSGKPVEKYNGSLCGASFAIAQAAGLFLLARQKNKDISFEKFIEVIKDTREKNPEGVLFAHAKEIIDNVPGIKKSLPIASNIEDSIINSASAELGQDVASASSTLKNNVKELQNEGKVVENSEGHGNHDCK